MPSTAISQSLTPAMEDYLETIYHLEQERRIARVRDIAKNLGVKMSSVSSALKSLSSKGLVKYDPHQFITLTPKGVKQAQEIVRRHSILKRFLSRVLYLDDGAAEDNACRMEHSLDPEVVEKLIAFMEFVEMCPVDQTKWVEDRSDSCDECVRCLDNAKQTVKDRKKAQKRALAKGLTLADASVGHLMRVESIKGNAKFRKNLAKDGLESGSLVEIVKREEEPATVHASIKGYNVRLSPEDAAKVLVKPF